MKIADSRLTNQGQISVPVEVRRRLGLVAGSVLEWDADGDRIIVRRAGKYSSEEVHETLFPSTPRARTLDEMKEGIKKRMRSRHARD